MKKVFTIVLMAAALLVANGQVKAQTKFGYISVNELLESMPDMKKADSSLQQFREALIQSARDKEATLNEGITKFNADSSKMTTAVKEVKRTELQKKLQELQGEDQRIQQELEKKQQELLAPLQKKALDAINAVAKESNYAYVFIKDALIVSPPADDIAPLVKKKLNIK
jgi:outer membrane protein